MPPNLRGHLQQAGPLFRFIQLKLPKALFAVALLMLAGTYGYNVGANRWFPFYVVRDAIMTARNIRFQLFQYGYYQLAGVSNVPVGQVEQARFKSYTRDHYPENFLITGGPYQFREFCPKYGCLAVVLTRQGKLVSAVPFIPSEFEKTPLVSLPYQELLYKPEKDLLPVSAIQLPGGDYVFNIQVNGAFPYGGGIVRVRQDGTIVWYRKDYAHHWSAGLRNGTIVTPARLPGDTTHVRISENETFRFACAEPSPMDAVEVLDLHGRLIKELPLFPALAASPFRGLLSTTVDPCDITHMNFVRAVGEPLAAKIPGTSPDDYLVSLRNISAFLIVDKNSGAIKRLYRGSFGLQHAVRPTPDGKIIMFDNEGGSYVGGPSRLLIYDPATGEERTIFPNKDTPKGLPVHSPTGGYIDISPDGTRAIVNFAELGRAYEVDLKSGKLLTAYDNLHNLQGLSQYPGNGTGKAVRAFVNQVSYAN